MARQFVAFKQMVHNRGKSPDSFLDELIDWARGSGVSEVRIGMTFSNLQGARKETHHE